MAEQFDLDTATFIGEGKWVKNSAHQVYEQAGRYFAVVVVDQMNREILEDSIVEIAKSEVSQYI